MEEGQRPFKSFLIFSILSSLFVLSMFFRVANAVIAPNLIQDLDLNAETLGILGGAFFYSFALLQIPMGPMLDRIGPPVDHVYPSEAYHLSFLICFLGVVVSLIFYVFSKGEK